MSAEIVDLLDRRGLRSDPVLMQVEAYWDGLRNGRDAPERAEVDPRGLSGVLPNCFVLERIAPGLAQFRVAGQAICDQMGLEMKGVPFSTMFLPEARDQLESVLERVFSEPETVRMVVTSPGGLKGKRLEGQMLLLPLRSDQGSITRAMGCVVLNGLHGQKPRRLDIAAVAQRMIPQGRPLLTRPGAEDTPRPRQRGAAEVVELRARPDPATNGSP